MARAARWSSALLLAFIVCGTLLGAGRPRPISRPPMFNYVLELNRSYYLTVSSTTDTATGTVTVNGSDPRNLLRPFRFVWDDGTVTDGYFPQSHHYADRSKNYVIEVTAYHKSDMTIEAKHVVARFVPSVVQPVALPADLRVTIPVTPPVLGTRLYTPPGGLASFADSSFVTVSRSGAEYLLSLAATIEMDFAAGDVYRPAGNFNQVVLRDPSASGGTYSLWYTNPVSFAASQSMFASTIGWSSLFHEMGHNISLNMPADYYYGGRIDGQANAIFSETMAQIFQHAAAWEIVNHAARYGIPRELAVDVATTARASAALVGWRYEVYVGAGAPFHAWNDPATPEDETFDTFMTLAAMFMRHAEAQGQGYREPLRRMNGALCAFGPAWAARYAQSENSVAADTFRATLLVAAMSHAFGEDLRAEFRALHFPIDDATYTEVVESAEYARSGIGN